MDVPIRAFDMGLDASYVISTWVWSAGKRGARTAGIKGREWKKEFGNHVASLVRDSVVRVHLAHDPSAPEVIWGYCATKGDVLVYAYVPSYLRSKGIAKKLISHALGGYPKRIECRNHWPWTHPRFQFVEESSDDHRSRVSA